eukprot:6104781-Amphidinium_carterae.1
MSDSCFRLRFRNHVTSGVPELNPRDAWECPLDAELETRTNQDHVRKKRNNIRLTYRMSSFWLSGSAVWLCLKSSLLHQNSAALTADVAVLALASVSGPSYGGTSTCNTAE